MEEQIKRYFVKTLKNAKNKYWCNIHPLGYIGINKNTGKEWKRCSQGYRFDEECQIRKD